MTVSTEGCSRSSADTPKAIVSPPPLRTPRTPRGPTALIVDDDPEILEDVRERLDAIGHGAVTASCMDDARGFLHEGHGLDYVLLDLEIPSRYGKPPLVQHGLNLLALANELDGDLPVVVMTAHGHDSSDLPAEVMRHGRAFDYIRKPFPRPGETHRTLEAAARGAHDKRLHALDAHRLVAAPFAAGALTFFADRVELDGIAICGDAEETMARRILDCLRVRTRNNRWKGFRGATLAKEVHAADAGSVARAICTLRAKAKDLLLAKGVRLGDQDLIASGGTGYRLGPNIACRDDAEDTTDVEDTRPDSILPQPDGDPDTVDLNDRQIEILDRLRAGQELRKRDLATEFDRSEKTIKRDLGLLKSRGLAEDRGAGNNVVWIATSCSIRCCDDDPKRR